MTMDNDPQIQSETRVWDISWDLKVHYLVLCQLGVSINSVTRKPYHNGFFKDTDHSN